MSGGRVAVVFGTRPEMIKLAPLIKLLGEKAKLIHTGQHFDRSLSSQILDDLDLSEPTLNLGVGGKTRAEQIGSVLLEIEDELADVSGVVVQGDTNSALAGGLAANALELPLFHVEAGLRSFDRRMPEEHNRVVVDHLADVCWAPTDVNVQNLRDEGIADARVEKTGNSIVEALRNIVPDQEVADEVLGKHGVSRRDFVIVTLHRPENVDAPDRLAAILEGLGQLDLPVVLPIHPRTLSTVRKHSLEDKLTPLRIIEPTAYAEFLSLLANSAVAISDSGGVQEEVSLVKVPLVVVRRSTERPEVLGTFAWLTDDPEEMVRLAQKALDGGRDLLEGLADVPTPYGDGTASERMHSSLRAFGVI
ncbi:MAG: UDP-N-acetylglucosamine 2-epimerase (non-hydrolyzing) [Actinobacteria bacterium]|nr:MAG: UDP-N-acetylglucosamine 2-epimerase (non-hydrolyzing) [Actinomycetota bacterium]